jgi:murein DD-endopeptidase MepM/ murein hydrolase activator NlpD
MNMASVFSRARLSSESSAPGRRSSTRWRSAVIGALVVLGALIAPVPVVAQTDQAAAEQAAREIQEARDRANAAADAYFQAESDLDVLTDDLTQLELETVKLKAAVERLRKDVESVAVSRFVGSGTAGIPLLTGLKAPQDQLQADVFFGVLANTGSDALDQFDIAQKELVANESKLDDRREDIEQQKVVFTKLQQRAEDEVVRLRGIEEVRLKDEAVRRALDAQLAAERVRLEEEARREAEAAARAIPDPGANIPAPTTTVLAEEDPAGAAESGSGADGTGNEDGSDTTEPGDVTDTTPTETTPPTTAAPSNSGASGGSSGGRTGTGGIGSNPRPVDTGAGYIDAIVCPINGSGFGDTWGAPRSGGRRHEGVDMIAPRGVPIIAVVTGQVTFKSNRLGGNAVSLVGDNGTRYYYAHLDNYEGASRRVTQGEVIGYNGDSGNARFSTPHLHFEIHPGGGLAVNPYPSVRGAGC